MALVCRGFGLPRDSACSLVTSSTPPADGSAAGNQPPPLPPDSSEPLLPWAGLGPLGLDRLGVTQTVGGLAIGLIVLFSSNNHLTVAGRSLPIAQQWGIVFIAASVATVVVDFVQDSAPPGRDAQLASRSRLRTAQDAERTADQADRERNPAAQARECQRQATARRDRCALLSARVLLEPSESNRARLQAFLALISQAPPET